MFYVFIFIYLVYLKNAMNSKKLFFTERERNLNKTDFK